MFQSSKISELQSKVTELEAKLAKATADHQASLDEVGKLQADMAQAKLDHDKVVADAGVAHANAIADQKAEFETRLQREITDALASAGVPEAKLPSRAPEGGATSFASAMEEYKGIEDATARAEYWAKTVAPLIGKHGAN